MKLTILCTAFLLPLYLSAQPVLVKDIMPSVFSSTPERLTVFNNTLYFFATDGVAGKELRSYDGHGIQLVKDIYPGSADCVPNTPNSKAVVLNGKMYFPADDGIVGLELFSYDGTKVQLASDIRGGANPSDISELVVLNGKLYFDADNGVNGKELWEYDPATGKALQLSYIHTSATGSYPAGLTVMNGRVYFSANTPATGTELYEYDPASGQVKLITDINPGSPGSSPSCLLEVFGKLFFTAVTADYGCELYVFDGNGVQRLTDMNPGTGDGFTPSVAGLSTLFAAGKDLYFAGNNGSGGFQLYKYDIANNTPVQVAVINPSGNSTPTGFIYYANKIFFTADDGMHGRELWVLDGNNPPAMVADINTNSAVNIDPAELTVYNNDLYFTAYGDMGTELYKYTDAAAGIRDFAAGTEVKVYPNPATSFVNITIGLQQNEEIFVRLLDATGRAAVTSRAKTYLTGINTIRVPMSELSAGMYYYHVGNSQGQTIASGRVAKM